MKSSVSGTGSVTGPCKSTLLALLQRPVETPAPELQGEIRGKTMGSTAPAEVRATSLHELA